MATNFLSRAFLSNSKTVASIFSRSFSSLSLSSKQSSTSFSLLFLNRFRPLAAVSGSRFIGITGPTVRGLATRPASSSVNDPNPNWSNRPPKETILLDGCDFEHWLVVMEPPEGEPTRDEVIDSYIKTLAMVVGSEEEARMKIYSVSTRCYFAFGALVSEELSYKIKELPRVRWVLPDSYLNVKEKDYGGEPFINGQAVPYDPKYHEEWIRNHARANERNRRNDRPRNFDRSRNYERRRENMQNRDFQNQEMQNAAPTVSGTPPPPNNVPPSSNMPPNMGRMPPNMGGMPPQSNIGGGMPPQSNMGGGMPPQSNIGGGMPPQSNMGGGMPPQSNIGGGVLPQSNMGGGLPPSNMGGMPPQNKMGGGMPPQSNMGGGMLSQNNYGGMPKNNYGGIPPQNNYGGMPPENSYGGMPRQNNYGGMPPQNYGSMRGQNNYEGMPPANNYGGMPLKNAGNLGGMPPNAGWSDNMPGNMQQSADDRTYQNAMPNTQFQK